MIRNSAVPTFGSTAKLTTSRLYLSQPQRDLWREPSSQYGANCPVSYTALSSSPGAAISNSSSGVQATYQNMTLRASHRMHRFYSGRASALYVVSQNGYANYASVISFRSLAIIHLLYHRSRTYKTRTVFVGWDQSNSNRLFREEEKIRYAYPVTRITGTRQIVSPYPLKNPSSFYCTCCTKSRRNRKDKYYFGETRDVITPYYDKTPVLLFTERPSQ